MNDRRLIEQELASTFDADIRQRLTAALRAGRGTPEWSGALAIIGIRDLGRDAEPPPRWEDGVWQGIERDQQRGRLVDMLARWIGGALIAAGAVMALVALVLWLGGWL